MFKLMTEGQLKERDRLTRVETMLNAFDGRMSAHEEDCLKDREATRDQIGQINDKIDRNHNEWRRIDDLRHKSNASMMSWSIKLLVTILLALLGYFGTQAFEHIDWSKVKIEKNIGYEFSL